MRIVMLIDMDYFYVACEELRNPELKDKPTIVGAHPKEGKGRGVVMTCNYAARKYGIHSGMPISSAYRIKPDANYLPTDFMYYEEKSREVMLIIKSYAYKMEQVSVDEAYVEVAEIEDYKAAEETARKVKSEIKEKTGLPCSIGISTNKLLAKMACSSAKPDGIKVVKAENAAAFLREMPVGDLYGIGRKTSEKLEKLGYMKIGDLAKANIMHLMEIFGSFGLEMHNYANGIDDSEVSENYEVKSISREFTFERDTNDREEVSNALLRLSKEVMDDVEKQGFSFKTVTLKRRYSDFSEQLKSRSIKPSNRLEDITETILSIYNAEDEKRKIRKLGVRVSGLTQYKMQKRLF